MITASLILAGILFLSDFIAVRQYEKAVNKGDNGAQEKLRNAQKQDKQRQACQEQAEFLKSSASFNAQDSRSSA